MMSRHTPILLACLLSVTTAYAGDIYSEADDLIKRDALVQAEVLLSGYLVQHEQDNQARYLLAKVQARQGNYAASREHYESLLLSEPANTDYMYGLAQVFFWQQQNEPALEHIQKARSLNPADSDIRRQEIQILVAINTPHSLEAAHSRSLEASQLFPGQTWPVIALANQSIPVRDIEVETGITADSLTNNRADWRGLYVFGVDKYSDYENYAMIEVTDRFDLSDNQLTLGRSQNFNHASANIELTYSSTGHVLAEWSVSGSCHFNLVNNTDALVGLKHSQYHLTENDSLILGLELNQSPYRLRYQLVPGHVSGAGSATSHLVGLDYYFGNENYFGCSMSDGTELEYDGITPPVLSDVSGARCYGRYWYKPKWAISYSIGYFEQGDFYNRNGILVGLRYNY